MEEGEQQARLTRWLVFKVEDGNDGDDDDDEDEDDGEDDGDILFQGGWGEPQGGDRRGGGERGKEGIAAQLEQSSISSFSIPQITKIW